MPVYLVSYPAPATQLPEVYTRLTSRGALYAVQDTSEDSGDIIGDGGDNGDSGDNDDIIGDGGDGPHRELQRYLATILNQVILSESEIIHHFYSNH